MFTYDLLLLLFLLLLVLVVVQDMRVMGIPPNGIFLSAAVGSLIKAGRADTALTVNQKETTNTTTTITTLAILLRPLKNLTMFLLADPPPFGAPECFSSQPGRVSQYVERHL